MKKKNKKKVQKKKKEKKMKKEKKKKKKKKKGLSRVRAGRVNERLRRLSVFGRSGRKIRDGGDNNRGGAHSRRIARS